MLAVAMDLRLASSTAERAGDPESAQALRSAEAVAFEALAELRRLARGVHPAILGQGGLGPALSALAEESAVPVTLELDRAERLPALVEAVAYESIADTVAAAVRLGAREVAVMVERDVRGLVLDIAFEGERLAMSNRMVDRVEAAGGSLTTTATGARGNRVHAVIPCA
jgi:signal transduction histidine kinase